MPARPNGSVKHVIIVQFDNVHLTRDNANVPSDIEQIPALHDFLKEAQHAAVQRPHGADLAHR